MQRLVAVAIIVVPFGLPLLLIPWNKTLTVLILFKGLLPATCCGFVMFAFSDYLWLRFNLVTIVQADTTTVQCIVGCANNKGNDVGDVEINV